MKSLKFKTELCFICDSLSWQGKSWKFSLEAHRWPFYKIIALCIWLFPWMIQSPPPNPFFKLIFFPVSQEILHQSFMTLFAKSAIGPCPDECSLHFWHHISLWFNKGIKDKRLVKTQLIFCSVGFGHMFWIKAIHRQAFMQDEQHV